MITLIHLVPTNIILPINVLVNPIVDQCSCNAKFFRLESLLTISVHYGGPLTLHNSLTNKQSLVCLFASQNSDPNKQTNTISCA